MHAILTMAGARREGPRTPGRGTLVPSPNSALSGSGYSGAMSADQLEDVDALQSMLKAYPAEEMDAYPISRYVNNPDNEGPRCVEPLLA